MTTWYLPNLRFVSYCELAILDLAEYAISSVSLHQHIISVLPCG